MTRANASGLTDAGRSIRHDVVLEPCQGAEAKATGTPHLARKARLTARGCRFKACSAFNAADRDGSAHAATMRSGGKALVKRAPRPARCAAKRAARSVVMPA